MTSNNINFIVYWELPDTAATEQELMAFVNSRVAFYKKLHRVYIVQSI
ncbi:MAG: hypothetical protein ACP5HK_01755 [Acidilobus sp.]